MKLPRELWIMILKWKTKYEKSERYLKSKEYLKKFLKFPFVKIFLRNDMSKYLVFFPKLSQRREIIYDEHGNLFQYHVIYGKRIILGQPLEMPAAWYE